MNRKSPTPSGPDSDAGVVFPLVDGDRSSMSAGQQIIASATVRIDTATHDAVRDEPHWRSNYLPHFRELTRLSAHQHGSLIAVDGLEAVHRVMRHRRQGAETTLLAALELPRAQYLHTHVVAGTEPYRARRLALPMADERLTGAALRRQVDRWLTAGTAEPSFGAAVTLVDDHAEWLDLRDTTVVVLGASAEIGPLLPLLDWGCRVVAVDLPGAALWQPLITYARRSPGTLVVPTRQALSDDASDSDVARSAGADVLTQSPEIAAWLVDQPGPFIVGDYVYAPGSTHVRTSAAIDAIIEHLLTRRTDVGLAYLATRLYVLRKLRDRGWNYPRKRFPYRRRHRKRWEAIQQSVRPHIQCVRLRQCARRPLRRRSLPLPARCSREDSAMPRPSLMASAICEAISFTARMASSLPGMTKSTSSGSQLVSTTATTGISRRCASRMARCSFLQSTMKIASGRPFMVRMPPER